MVRFMTQCTSLPLWKQGNGQGQEINFERDQDEQTELTSKCPRTQTARRLRQLNLELQASKLDRLWSPSNSVITLRY